MNTQSAVIKQNEEQAKALYNKERSKTQSEQYLDYFVKWSEQIETLVAKTNMCVTNYEKHAGGLEEQTKFITPHVKLLKAYSAVLASFIDTFKDNITKDPQGKSNAPILKMRNIDDLDLIFDSLVTEIKFLDKVFTGEFDTRGNQQNTSTSGTQTKPLATLVFENIFAKNR